MSETPETETPEVPEAEVGAEPTAAPWQVDPVYSRSMADLLTPGVIVEVSEEEAEAWGAFEETALSEADAWESIDDLPEDDSEGAGE